MIATLFVYKIRNQTKTKTKQKLKRRDAKERGGKKWKEEGREEKRWKRKGREEKRSETTSHLKRTVPTYRKMCFYNAFSNTVL